jgi:hypothetical protein
MGVAKECESNIFAFVVEFFFFEEVEVGMIVGEFFSALDIENSECAVANDERFAKRPSERVE